MLKQKFSLILKVGYDFSEKYITVKLVIITVKFVIAIVKLVIHSTEKTQTSELIIKSTVNFNLN